MQQLALQVAHVHDIEIDNAQGADAGGREIHRRGRSEPARANAQDLRRFEPPLPVHADLGQYQMPAVALDLVG